MKKTLTLFLVVLYFISYKGQNSNYPELIDEKEDYYANYSYKDYKNKFHQEYAFYYKRTVTKDNKSYNEETARDKRFPWEILKKSNPQEFFNQITNSIKIEDLGDDKINITLSYNLTNEQIIEYRKTGGILNKDELKDLLNLEVLSWEIFNTTSKEKIEAKTNWTIFCCNIFPNDNPTKEKLFYYNDIGYDYNKVSGKITVRLTLPTDYKVTEITKNDIGKVIEIGENEKVKIIEFVDNKVHFEVMSGEKLNSKIEFVGVSPFIKGIHMPKYLYDFFRFNPKMKYSEFVKQYQTFLDKDEDDLAENMVYVYTLEGKPDKFYFYSTNKKTLLEKDVVLKIN